MKKLIPFLVFCAVLFLFAPVILEAFASEKDYDAQRDLMA